MKKEHDEQVALIDWAKANEDKYPALKMLFAIPNGGLRNVVVAKKLKDEGVKAGVPDLFLAVAKKRPDYLDDIGAGYYHGLFIEMKSERGKLTENQKIWIALLGQQNFLCKVCHGFIEARQVICDYLGIKEG